MLFRVAGEFEILIMDLMWDLLDRDVSLPDLVMDWTGINAEAFQAQMVTPHYASA